MPSLPPPCWPPPQDAPDPGRHRWGGSDSPSRPVDDHDAHQRCQRHAQADRRAHRGRVRHRARACPSQDDADALPPIARKSNIPVIADIHFQPKYVYAAIDAGCAASGSTRATSGSSTIRSPRSPSAQGRGRFDPDRRQRRQPLDKRLLAKCSKRPRRSSSRPSGRPACSRSMASTTSRSRSSTTTRSVMVRAYELNFPSAATGRCTSASPRPGPAFQGTIKSATAFGACSPRGSATPSVFRCRRRRRRGEGRHPDPAEPEPAPTRPDRLLPELRACPGRCPLNSPTRSPPASRA